MVVQHNLASMNANRNLSVSTGSIKKSGEKLSSGYKINRAADDAAGLTISEKMRSQIRGLTQASANAQDGISFTQTADGTLEEVSSMLKRSKELAVKASTETLTAADRMAIQEEIESINSEIDRVQQSSTFNDFRIFINDGYAPSQTGIDVDRGATNNLSGIPIEVTINMVDGEGHRIEETVDVQGTGETNYTGTKKQLADFAAKAVDSAAARIIAAYPNLMGEASTGNVKIGLNLDYIDGPGNTLAQASIRLVTGGGNTTAGYTMKIDTTDYKADEIFGSMSASQREARLADLAAVISHEMTHLVMYDTMPQAMLKGNTNSLPKWFKEGMAQTSSGDNGWVTRDSGVSDAYLDNKIKELTTEEYGMGYVGVMYLGYLAGGGNSNGSDMDPSTVTSVIRNGLDRILTDIANGDTLSQAIKNHTGFMSQKDFEDTCLYHPEEIRPFFRKYLDTVGPDGAGSVLGSTLSETEGSLFSTSSVNASPAAANYNLDTAHRMVSNSYAGDIILIPAPDVYEDGMGKLIYLQVGAANKEEQRIAVKRFNISCDSLFEGEKMDVSTVEEARASLARIDKADLNVSGIRSYYGAVQNRLEHTILNLDNIVENTTAAESQIRDTDMAKEMVNYTKTNVLIQAGNAMLSQAMQNPQNILQLLQ